MTISGSIESEFKIILMTTPGEGRGSGEHINTTIGHGGAHIQIETFSGDIRLQRLSSQGDGRTGRRPYQYPSLPFRFQNIDAPLHRGEYFVAKGAGIRWPVVARWFAQ